MILLEIKLLIDLRVSKASSKNNSETNEEEILRERYIYIYISPEKRQKTVDMIMYNNGISNNKKIY